MSCKLLPGVAMVHAEILSYLHIYKYKYIYKHDMEMGSIY